MTSAATSYASGAVAGTTCGAFRGSAMGPAPSCKLTAGRAEIVKAKFAEPTGKKSLRP